MVSRTRKEGGRWREKACTQYTCVQLGNYLSSVYKWWQDLFVTCGYGSVEIFGFDSRLDYAINYPFKRTHMRQNLLPVKGITTRINNVDTSLLLKKLRTLFTFLKLFYRKSVSYLQLNLIYNHFYLSFDVYLIPFVV